MRRTLKLSMLMATGLLSSVATGNEPLPASVVACQSEPDDARRLACYDREVRRYAATPEQRFGLRGRQAAAAKDEGENEEGEELRNITANVTAISRRPHGEYVLTLDNGQVWVQTQAGSPLRLSVGDDVTIRSAAFGSFLLSGPNGGSTRVARIR